MKAKGWIIFLCLNVVEPLWRPITRPKERYKAKIFPHQMNEHQLAQLKIPNNMFCSQMERQTAGMYILMPWWYNYCQDLKEKRAKQYKNVFYKPIYKTILNHVKWHQRHKRERERTRRNEVIWHKQRI